MAAKPQAVPEPDTITELDDLGGRTRTIIVGRHRVEVRELALREIVKSWKPLAQIFRAAAAGATVQGLFELHLDDMLAVLSITTGREPDWLVRVPGRKLLDMGYASFEINSELFLAGVQIRDALMSLAGLGSGLTPSSSSSAPESATPTG